MIDLEGDEPLPDSIADIADEHGVTEAQLRAALRESHPDASVAEVILRAREIPEPRGRPASQRRLWLKVVT